MNLGQLIDPRWAQERFPERNRARRPGHPAEQLMITTHIDGRVDRRPQGYVAPPPPPKPVSLYSRALAKPYEQLAKYFSKTNYSPVRASATPPPKPGAAQPKKAEHLTRMRTAPRPAPRGEALLKHFEGRKNGASAGLIARLAGVEISLTCAHMRRLLQLELITRSGTRRKYQYTITAKGLDRLKVTTPEG